LVSDLVHLTTNCTMKIYAMYCWTGCYSFTIQFVNGSLIDLFCLLQKCHVKKKDIRKFLDGIYVSDKGAIKEE
jgi:hypothetical protein